MNGRKLAALIAVLTPMKTNAAEKPLIVQIFKMPESVEPAAVTTAGHYILASHLVRPLTKLDKYGKLQGDIAVKWVPSADHRTWTITLAPAKFSDGSPITSRDVAATIERQRKLGAGVHFPFAQIAGVRAVGDHELEVTLTTPRNDFIYDLSKPEFGVLSPADVGAAKGAAKFAVTSGAYSLARREGLRYVLHRNPHFLADVKNDHELVLEGSDGEGSATALSAGGISFFTTQQPLSEARHDGLARQAGVRVEKPHVGFSYWLSVNPESPLFAGKPGRAQLQKLVADFVSPEMSGHSWEKADQLYLPDGDGRPSASELAKAWRDIRKAAQEPSGAKPKLRVVPLKTTNSLLDGLLAYLKRHYEIEMVPYTTEDELIAILKSKKFDVKISSNDFSSIDLSENLKTTFNPQRPYVFLDAASPVPKLLQQAVETNDKAAQSRIFREIGLNLLRTGLVAPLAYQRTWFYYDRKLDIGAWSHTFPEISFWKVKVAHE